ncbi:DUF6932 family protein [Allokutzneria sp. A3M-2-11 16]|uniref:DUF6932 family protein n=1 Tax=Allokutzneria sp. A3M-2-11 16 TaxID=2962043 RepID=UPI0035A95D9F
MLPELHTTSGHLPPGRYRVNLSEVQARFVAHRDFSQSSTRQLIWDGFRSYLAAWKVAEDNAGVGRVLKLIWLAGSFISMKLDPDDLDVTPVIDRHALLEAQGQRGSKALRRLIEHRDSIVANFRVEPFVLDWVPSTSTLRPNSARSLTRDYLERRGSLDDWWQRVRPPGPKLAPLLEDAPPRRGYLEVERP